MCPPPGTAMKIAAGAPTRHGAAGPRIRTGLTLLQTRYIPDCFDGRNRYMVDHSDFIIAVWDDSSGGTGNTISHARSLEKQICVIPAHTRR